MKKRGPKIKSALPRGPLKNLIEDVNVFGVSSPDEYCVDDSLKRKKAQKNCNHYTDIIVTELEENE